MKKKKFETPELTMEELSAELVVTNLRLKNANLKLKKAERARNEMFSNISHDLRSPMTAIKNAIELLNSMEELTKENAAPYLQMMTQRIDVMEQLINDIFLLVSLENDCVQLNATPVSIGFFLEDFFFSREVDGNYQSRNLELLVPVDLDATVYVDTANLTRVLDNLFTNALKYSKNGATISLDAKIADQEVIVSVSDTGIGIPEDCIEQIFERSFIVEKARTPGVSSTGLGLSICQAIIEHFSGRIWCESTYGKGSCFSFSLPLYEPEKNINE